MNNLAKKVTNLFYFHKKGHENFTVMLENATTNKYRGGDFPPLSPSAFIVALVYIDRFYTIHPLNHYFYKDPRVLFLISTIVASKMLNDETGYEDIQNWEWAKSSTISVQTINKLEKEFLNIINWDAFVDTKTFTKKLNSVQRCKKTECKNDMFNFLFSVVKPCPGCNILIFKTTPTVKTKCSSCKTVFNWDFQTKI